jgi:hypothetical protein
MSACCNAASDRKPPTRARRVREISVWLVPSALLALTPKCPVCLAAYVTLWTGLGVSLSTATYLRSILLFLCVTSLLFVIVARLGRVGANSRVRNKMAGMASVLWSRRNSPS